MKQNKQKNKQESWADNPCYRIKGGLEIRRQSKPLKKSCLILRVLHVLSEKFAGTELY